MKHESEIEKGWDNIKCSILKFAAAVMGVQRNGTTNGLTKTVGK
jgi:hypothetical protein